MGKQFTRAQVLHRLHGVKQAGRPILAACPGSGLNAKLCELGGADLITLVHTGLVRQKGLPSIASLDRPPNETVREMMAEQFAVTKDIPITCGIEVGDYPAQGDLDALIDSFLPLGFSGVMNYPTSGEIASPEFMELAGRGGGKEEYQLLQHSGEQAMLELCRRREQAGVGYGRELELIRRCRERDIFTAVYAFTAEQAAQMAAAGADCICGHCGGTGGGLVGHAETADHRSAARRLQAMVEAAHAAAPDVLVLGHGGPFSTPEDTALMYQYCQVDGFVAGSAVDRIPAERAIPAAVRAFKETGK